MIRVFVGTSPDGADAEAQAVLEYSLRRHASETLEITWMALTRAKGSVWAGWNPTSWSTPFTPFRWTVPEACGFDGRAIYMDVDTFAVADIAQLWRQPMGGKAMLIRETEGKLRTCVALFDCSAAKAVIPPLAELKRMHDPHKFMVQRLRERRQVLGAFDGQWNCIDLKRSEGLTDPTLKVVHYSSMAHQPHLKHARPRLAAKGLAHWYDGETAPHWRPELEARFDQLLAEAIAAGFAPARYEPAETFGDFRKKSFAGRPAKKVA